MPEFSVLENITRPNGLPALSVGDFRYFTDVKPGPEKNVGPVKMLGLNEPAAVQVGSLNGAS